MKEKLKAVRADFLFSSVLCVIFGVILMLRPIEALSVFCSAIGVIMILIGAGFALSYFMNAISNGWASAVGIVIALMGVWILISPDVLYTLIPIIIGIVLLTHGIRDLEIAVKNKRYGASNWGIGVVLAIISIAFAIFCILQAFNIVKGVMFLVGAALVFNGITNIWLSVVGTKNENRYRNTSDPIDVEFKD